MTGPFGVWEQVAWDWRDPAGITHLIRKLTTAHAGTAVSRVLYRTWCGHEVSVDDVNNMTKCVRGGATCIRCSVALEPDGGP